MRAVVDPNVLVSAVLTPGGGAQQLLEAIDAGTIELIVSTKLLGELDRVLHRDKFRQWASVERVEEFVAALAERGHLVRDPHNVPKVTRDPDDDYLVALARV